MNTVEINLPVHHKDDRVFKETVLAASYTLSDPNKLLSWIKLKFNSSFWLQKKSIKGTPQSQLEQLLFQAIPLLETGRWW